MKVTIELDKEQAQSLIDAMQNMFDELNRKIEHLKGRVRRLEENISAEAIAEVVRETIYLDKRGK